MRNGRTLEDKEMLETQILAAIRDMPSLGLQEVAQAVDISRFALYRLMESNPGMARRIQRERDIARGIVVEDVESVMVQRALDPKNPTGVTAGIFLLKAHKPKLYGDKVSASAGGITVNIDKAQINLERQTTEEMRALEGPEDE